MVRFHRRDESIPPMRYRLNVKRVFRIVSQRRPKFLDDRVDTVLEVDKGIGRPEFLANLLARHKLPRPLQQKTKGSEQMFLKLDPCSVLS